MSFNGEMPLVGGGRFGIYSKTADDKKQDSNAKIVIVAVPVPNFSAAEINKAASQAPPSHTFSEAHTGTPEHLSATKKPLFVGQRVRGSDQTTNRNVDCDFRGVILEFIPINEKGNNVRVKCEDTGKVYKVNCKDIRGCKKD